MRTRVAILVAVCAWSAPSAHAHRLDEYLQATMVAVDKDRVTLRLRMVPGAEVAGRVLVDIDTDGDKTISDAEQRAYAERVRRDLSVALDGRPLELRLIAWSYPTVEDVTKGRGDIVLEFEAAVLPGGGARRLVLENRHHSAAAVYLVNCLVPADPDVRIVAQNRNHNQSSYQLDFTSGDVPDGASPSIDSDGLSVVKTYFVHGVHHILTGFDHLLFLSALVLTARTPCELVKVVTAFTLAHSVTLTLAARGLVHLPEALVEPLIAASIVFVALQNIFWPVGARGRSRLAVAFFFGLFHGLGFAGGLLDVMHALPGETALQAILGFSAGVEAGHLLVLLPLFGLLTAVRYSQQGAVAAVQRGGSAAVLIAGAYYLCAALVGNY